MTPNDKDFLISLFEAAIAAADPTKALQPHLPDRPKGRTIVVGAGKGCAQLAAALEKLWGDELEGVVVTRYGYAVPCRHVQVLEAAHPVPDEAGLVASQALLQAVSNLCEDDLVIALICGGGSSLLPAPPAGFELQDEQALNSALLKSGAPIGVMNAIRKHFSQIKGGRLAEAAFPARVVSLIVSDVPGDDPAEVASGPTIPSDVSLETAQGMIRNYKIDLPEKIQTFLDSEAARAPSPNDSKFSNTETKIIASARISLTAAKERAISLGVPAIILSDAIEGEARDVGLVHAAIAQEIARHDSPFNAPVVLLSGGETTVTILQNGGRGGRNTEFLLSFASAIEGSSKIVSCAADTDGIDGSETNAGAFADGASASRMRNAGIDPTNALTTHDAWTAFNAIDDLFEPGPTGTNVNDFRAILIKAG